MEEHFLKIFRKRAKKREKGSDIYRLLPLLVSRATVKGEGENELTSIPPNLFSPVTLDQSTPIRGFLVVQSSPDMRYTPDSDGRYASYKSNDHFAIMVGDGVTSYPFRVQFGTKEM